MATEDANGASVGEKARTVAEAASRSVRESAGVLQGAEQLAALVASGNEQAVANEQVRTAIESVAASLTETGVAAQSLVHSLREVDEAAKRAQQASAGIAGNIQVLMASISSVRMDAASLVASADSTTAKLEETAVSVKGVSGRAMETAAAYQELVVTQMMAHSKASLMMDHGLLSTSATAERAVPVEQMSKGIARLATDTQGMGEHIATVTTAVVDIGEWLSAVATDATNMAAMMEQTVSISEQLASGVQQEAETVRMMGTAAATTAATMTEVAARMEEVAATAEKNAAAVDTHAATIEQFVRSGQVAARDAKQINSLAATSVTASGQVEASTRRLAQMAEVARATGERVSTTAREGGATVARSIASFSRLRQSITESAGVIKEMGQHAEELGGIVQTINLIADRTTLLSLFASIEAARAGEHGRGFAMVAEEIRALADQAVAASADVAKLVQGLQISAREAVATTGEGGRLADEGATLAGNAERALGSIFQGVDELGTTVREVSRATSQQVHAVQSLSQATARVSEHGRHIVASAAQQAHAAQALAQEAAEMRRMARQTTRATEDQARVLRDAVRSNEQIASAAALISRDMQVSAEAAGELEKAAIQVHTRVHQVSTAVVARGEEMASLSTLAQDMTAATQRTLTSITELAKGATEVDRAMDETRKQAADTVASLSQMYAALCQIGSAMHHTKDLVDDVLSTSEDQCEKLASLTLFGKDLQRLAWQTSTKLEQQMELTPLLAAATTELTASLGAMARLMSGHATLSPGS